KIVAADVTRRVWSTVLVPSFFLALASRAEQTNSVHPLERAGYHIIERGGIDRTWVRTVLQTNEQGQVTPKTNRIVELTKNRWDHRQWVDANPQIHPTEHGARGHGGSHEIVFAKNANSYGALQIRLPASKSSPEGGPWFKAHVLGLAYQDSTGSNVMFAVP